MCVEANYSKHVLGFFLLFYYYYYSLVSLVVTIDFIHSLGVHSLLQYRE